MKVGKKMQGRKSRTKLSGFGSTTARFGVVTLHPNLDSQGLYTARDRGCDPCLYYPKPIYKIYSLKSNINPWQYKAFVEDWSKNLGYRNQDILQYRRWMATIGGPAWCQTPEQKPYEPACKNVSFGRVPRFKPSKTSLPGPGTYYNAHPFKPRYGPHSTRPTFEREEPCRFKDPTPRWSLAPDRYSILDKDCIEQKSKKIVSIHGPYKLFTGKRDGSTIKNHFNDSLKCHATTWPLALPGCMERYKKTQLGVMNKSGRNKRYFGRNSLVDTAMAYRSPEQPGPAHLNIDQPKTFKENQYGFNSSYVMGPGYQRAIIWPGVGRYRTPPAPPVPGRGHRHVFMGHDERTMGAYLPQPYNTF